MQELEQRKWMAPDGVEYRIRLTEQVVPTESGVRRLRRLHFDSLDGEITGTALVPGYLMLDMATSYELHEFYRRATGS